MKRSPIRSRSKKRQAEFRERKAMLMEAYGKTPRCFVCGGMADDAHELLSRARGGSITDPENVRPVCREDHRRITENPAWAEENGYALRRES